MADYSANATTLSAPQGAGASPVAPSSSGLNLEGVGQLVNIFARGLRRDAKEDAEARKRMVLQNYVNDENTITSAVLRGDIKPEEAAVRSQANFRKYAGGFGDLTQDLHEARKNLVANTEAGEIQYKIMQDKQMREADIKQASERGFLFTPNMSKEAQDAQINAAKAAIQAENTLRNLYAANSERRAQGTYDQQIAEKQTKETTVKLLGTVAGTNLESFQKFAVDLGNQVRSQKMTPETAKANLASQFATIEASLVAASQLHPELANGWRQMFDKLNAVGQDLIDPKKTSENSKAQLDNIISKAKLLAVTTSPEVLRSVVASEFYPQNPAVMDLVATGAAQLWSVLNGISPSKLGYTPQAIGNPEVEADILNLAKNSLRDMAGGKIKKDEVVKAQAFNSVSQILKQTGKLLDQGATPDQMVGPMSFIASAEYGNYAKEGNIDPQANEAAKKILQLSYGPAVVKSVQERLNSFLYEQAAFGKKKGEPVTTGSLIDVNFTGAGVVFTPKPSTQKLDPVQQKDLADKLQSLKSAQAAINQLIHAGTHLNYSTDYAKTWEETKHILFPDRFTAPEPSKKGSKSTEPTAADVALTPAEQARGDRYDRSAANLKELQDEIDKAKTPQIKAILQAEMDRLKGK